MRPRSKKRNRLGKFLGMALLGLVLLGVVGVVVAKAWLNRYLGSPEFRDLLSTRIGRAAHAECKLEPLTWSASGVYSPSVTLTPAGGQAWKSLQADGLQATLDWSTVRGGVWSIPSVNLDSLRIETQPATPVAQKPLPHENVAEKESMPGWLQRWLPQRTEIGDVHIEEFEIKPVEAYPGVAISGMKVNAKPTEEGGPWLLRGSDGTLALPGMKEPFHMTSASASIDANALLLSDAVATWLGDSEVTGRGTLPFAAGKPWSFSGHLSRLDLHQILSADWKTRLSGTVEGDYEASQSSTGDVLLKGKVNLKNGVVQNLPVLDRVASFTHTERFKRVVLDEAHWDVERLRDTIQITHLVLQSNGLIRVEGDMTIHGRNLAGTFLVGVSPETLRWMPGSEAHVFTESHPNGSPGFVWTHVHLSGNLDGSIKEDLSNRLLAAMGQSLIDAPLGAVQTGVDILGKSGGTVIDTSKGVLKEADDVVGKGVDAVKGLVPFLK